MEDREILEEMIKRLDKNCFDIYRKSKNIEDYLGTITGREIISVENLLKENENLKQAIKINQDLYETKCNENKELKEKCKYEWVRQNCLPMQLVNKLYIPKSLVKEKIEELEQEDLEIYDTDSEDVRIAKYEQRAVLDFSRNLLGEE